MLVTQQEVYALMAAAARVRPAPRWLVVEKATGVVLAESRFARPPSSDGVAVVWVGVR